MSGRKKRKRILLPLLSLKLCLCQVTTNRKSGIKTQPPRPPPSTQCRLCQLPLTNNHTVRLLWHILPGGLNNRKASSGSLHSMHAVLESRPDSTRVLHAPRLRRGYLKYPLPAPMLEDACFPVSRFWFVNRALICVVV